MVGIVEVCWCGDLCAAWGVWVGRDMMIAPMNEKEVSYLMKLFEVATSDCMMTDLGIRPGKARCTDTFVCR